MSGDDTASRLAALEAKVAAQAKQIARLVDVASRLFDLIGDRTLLVTEELVDRDVENAAVTAQLEAAIRSRAPRGFKFPITIHTTVVEDRPKHFWVTQNYSQMVSLSRITRLESLLERLGVISSSDKSDLNVAGGDYSTLFAKRMRECFPEAAEDFTG